jgi:hypothetical protein
MEKPDKTAPVTELDRIYNDPDTKHALDLSERFAKKSLNEIGFKEFLNTLPPEAAQERAKLEHLIANPGARVEADLSTHAGQMVWAAGLGFVFQNSSPGTIRSSAVWKTLTRNPDLQNSLGAAARYLDLSLTNRNATMDWGTPGSWFWFSPDKNHINIDMFHTLLLGFGKSPAPGMKGIAHATGVMMHEVGHSQLTTRWTDGMKALQEQEAKLMAESKTRKLTRDEYKQLTRIRTEFKLRHNVMNATEDNCVNRYAANQGREFPHDFGESLNICNIVLQGTGYYLKTKESAENGGHSDFSEILKKMMTGSKQKEIQKAGEALSNLSKAIMLAFYSTNGLFETKDVETWKRLGVDVDAIKGTDGSDFNDLMKQNLSTGGIANLQPAARDRWLLRSVFARSIESYADRRCKIIDDIWDKYAAPYAKVLINAAEENAEKKMDQKAQEKDKGKDQKPGDQQEGDGDGQSDPNQQGEKQSGKGKGKGQSQQGGDDAAPSQGNPGGGGDEEEQSGGDDSSVEVEGVGKMDAGEGTPSTPQQSQKKERQGQGEEDVNSDNAKTVRDLARDAKQQERKNNAANDKSGNGKNGKESSQEDEKPADLSMDSGDGSRGRGKGVDLASLSGGNWSEFRKRINELELLIARVSDDFVYIRDKQKQLVRDLSKKKEKLPRGGDVRERLDMRAHMNFAVKRATGQKIEEQDLQRWKKDQIATEATSVELWILGDGSGSMLDMQPGGWRPIDPAVQSMAVLYEAGKRANFDTFVGMWGDDQIRMLAEPGDTDQKVGDNFQRAHNGIRSGTELSPAFIQAIQRSARQETNAQGKPKRFAGMTHFLIISDGELNGGDTEPLTQMILKLFRYGPAVSVDIAVLGTNTGTQMSQVVTAVKQANPAAAIGIINASSAKDIPIRLAQQIKRRFEQSAKEVQAIPDSQKREAFLNACKAIRQQKLG